MIRLFRVAIPTSLLVLVACDALLLAACFIVPARWTQELPVSFYLFEEDAIQSILFVVFLILLGLYLGDLYQDFREHSSARVAQQLLWSLGIVLLVQSVLSYVRSPLIANKWLLLYGSSAALIALPLWRTLATHIINRRLGAEGILFLGASPIMREIAESLTNRPEFGLVPEGYLAEDRCAEMDACKIPYFGPPDAVGFAIHQARPGRILVDGNEMQQEQLPLKALFDYRFQGGVVELASVTYETVFGRVATRNLQPFQFILTSRGGIRKHWMVAQSVYSWVLALIGCGLTLPVMLLVAVAVRATSRGPVLFRQTRVGLNNTNFTLYKFRSMYADAESRTGAVWAQKDDPRITPVGRYLRKWRLDELPQFFNVLRGDMVIVGPRPERPEFTDVLMEKIPYFFQRLSVKPGITGWAQINHKYGDTLEDTIVKLEYDLYYIKNRTLSLDAYIIFNTAKVMLLSRGAQ